MSTYKRNPDEPLASTALPTRLVHAEPVDASGFKSQHTPVYRGSSTFFSSTAEQRRPVDPLGIDYSYGLHGTPTQYTLCKKLADIEGALHALVCPSGLSAISIVAMACLKSGDHWLIPGNAYGPVWSFAHNLKSRFGVEVDEYDPMDPAQLSNQIKPNTKLIWTEAPGSLTFETPDLHHIVDIAKSHGILTAIDNTWSAGLVLKPFELGIDFSVQALTKYQCGHADVLMGAVLGNNTDTFRLVEQQNRLYGLGVSPSDCELVLRGLVTLPVRYQAQAESALQLALALKDHPAVHRVLHPALPECPGHLNWQTQFTGSASLFAVQLKAEHTDAQACAWVDALKWFKIAYSWGGPESLAVVVNISEERRKRFDESSPGGGPIVRLAVGLEDLQDLKADVLGALDQVFTQSTK